MAISCFLLHLVININGAYGFFRDELYYLACSDHLAWGYVDQPPFSLFLLKVSRLIFGDSLVAVRIVPALCISALIWTAALIVKNIGGGFFAIFLAALCVLVSPIHLAMGSFYSMNPIDMLVWALVALCVVRIVNTDNRYLWLVLGLILGIGLLNKISVLFIGAGLAAGILMTQRKWLKTPWPYAAGAIAFVLFLPYIIWNLQHDMAHIEFMNRASEGKYSGRDVFDFIGEIIRNHHPLAFPLWMAGLIAIFFYTPLKKYSIIGWLFLIPLVILLLKGTSKGEYLSPGIALMFAAGACFVEQKLNAGKNKVWYVYPVVLVITAIILLPLVTPVLKVEKYISYSRSLGIEPSSNENKELAELPQFYADMFGWEEKARDVAKVFNTLSEDDKKRCAIFSVNYGRCGAIDFFGKQYGLPKSIGNHNNYWIWGPREYKGEVVIILGGDMEDHFENFDQCTLAGVSSCQYCMPYENNVNIFLCRGFKGNLQEIWAHEKHYD
jgi:hypothetical protein